MKHINRQVRAFSLTELLVVLVIIGILILLALPNLMPQVANAKATEAKINLKQIYTLQQTYFMEHTKYADNLEALRFESQKTKEEGGNANYVFEIVEASTSGFTAKATAVADFDGDGNINQWIINQEMQLEETVVD